jgi:hypothetical protein
MRGRKSDFRPAFVTETRSGINASKLACYEILCPLEIFGATFGLISYGLEIIFRDGFVGSETALAVSMITVFGQRMSRRLIILHRSNKFLRPNCPAFERPAPCKKAKSAYYSVYGLCPIRVVQGHNTAFQTF